jgi:predicted N-acetyltransferase YhbS
MAMTEMRIHRDADLSAPEIESIVRLVDKVWPAKDRTFADRLRQFTSWVEENRRTGFEVISLVVWDGGQAVAHARTFPRLIHCQSTDLTIMGLAGVCVSPERRGEGLGRDIVRKAFERVDGGEFVVSLFQTAVPGFYTKLGARCISNRFVNSQNSEDPEANPWWDPNIMIYPAGATWPEGTIDLNGQAY